MEAVTLDHRKKELSTLLELIRAHPSRDWTRERQRVVVLQAMIEGAQRKAEIAHA